MLVTARQLESFMFEHNGRFNSRDYDKFERMELMESPVRDAIHELKTYSLETLAQCFDVRLFGRGKRVFARLDAEDVKWYYFSLAYIPRALNNRDVNDAIVQMFFIGKWRNLKRKEVIIRTFKKVKPGDYSTPKIPSSISVTVLWILIISYIS